MINVHLSKIDSDLKMETLPNLRTETLSDGLKTEFNQLERSTPSSRCTSGEPNCPCCSDALLRPMRLEEVYWRCSCRYRETSI